jgi:hypothetical protein
VGKQRKYPAIADKAPSLQHKPVINESANPGQKQMEFFTPYELHKRWSKAISLKTLANWRSLGLGPPYSKIGGRILYRIGDILTWENQNRFSTKM